MPSASLTAESLTTAQDINTNSAGLTPERISALRQEFEKNHLNGFVDDHDRVLRDLRPAIQRLEGTTTLADNVRKELASLRESMSLRLYAPTPAATDTLTRPGDRLHSTERTVRQSATAVRNFASDRPVATATGAGLGLFALYALGSRLFGRSREEADKGAAEARERSGGSFFKWAIAGIAGAVGLGYLVNRARAGTSGPRVAPPLSPTATADFEALVKANPNGLTFAQLDTFLATQPAGTVRDLMQTPVNLDGKKFNFDAQKNFVVNGKKYRLSLNQDVTGTLPYVGTSVTLPAVGLDVNELLESTEIRGNNPMIALNGNGNLTSFTNAGTSGALKAAGRVTRFINRSAFTTITNQLSTTPITPDINIDFYEKVAATEPTPPAEVFAGEKYKKTTMRCRLTERP